jgi:hypothetical protein
MGRRRAAGRCRGGGEGISASRAARAALGAGVGALAVAGSLAAWVALLTDGATRDGALVAGGVAVLVLAVGLILRTPTAVPAAIVLLGGEYALVLSVEGSGLDTRAAVVAAGLLVAAELAYWSLELRAEVTDEPGSYARRLAVLALLALGALALAGMLLAVVDLAGREGLAVEIAGAGAALAAVVLLWSLARRPPAG